MRVLLDTNVLVSAILFGGLPRDLLRQATRGQFAIVTSEALLDELERVLTRLGMAAALARLARQEVEQLAVVAVPIELGRVVRDPADDVVLGTAVAGSAAHVVTGDRDLLDLARYEGVAVVTPRAFIELSASRDR